MTADNSAKYDMGPAGKSDGQGYYGHGDERDYGRDYGRGDEPGDGRSDGQNDGQGREKETGRVREDALENNFDPDGVGLRNGNYFGMTFEADDAALVLVSVPWDVTSSYGGGAAAGPDAMIEESPQLDFHDPWAPGEWRKGIATLPVDYSIHERSVPLREDALKIIEALETGHDPRENFLLARKLEKINAASAELNAKILGKATYLTDKEYINTPEFRENGKYGSIRRAC